MPNTTPNAHDPVTIQYRELGRKDRPSLVLIPPLIWGASVYEPILPALAAEFHLIVCELHGHGQSGYHSEMSLEGMAEDFYRLIASLGLQQISLVGYSIGGMIGLRLALAHPELIDRLVLIASSADEGDNEVGRQTQVLWELFRQGERESIADPALKFFFSEASYARRPELIADARAMLIGISRDQAESMYAAARCDFARADICNRLGELTMPVLLIAGAEDATASPQEARRMAEHLPNARVLVIPENNHLLALESPALLAGSIQDFVMAFTPATV